MLTKILRHLRRRFIDAPRGFGHPVPAAAFDAEYRSGHGRRPGSFFTTGQAITTTNGGGDKTWDIRILFPVTAHGGPRP